MRRWRGLKSLVHDAVDHTTALIEHGHDSAARTALRVVDLVDPGNATAREIDAARGSVPSGVLSGVRAVNRAVESVTDLGVDLIETVVAPSASAAVPMR